MDLSEEEPAMSVAQRVKKYRDKRKHDLMFKAEENKRIENLRKLKVGCMSDTEQKTYRAAARERKRRSRQQKKIASTKSGHKSYRSHYVKKTVKNTYKSLPRAPAEQAEVLSKLAEQALLKLQAACDSKKKLQKIK